MRSLLAILDRGLGALERASGLVAGVAIGCAVVLSSADVIGRYLLRQPISWSYEFISGYLLVAIFFLAFAAVQKRQEHIAIVSLATKINTRFRNFIVAIAFLFSIAMIAVIGLSSFYAMVEAATHNLVRGGKMAFPTWPTYAIVLVGCSILIVRLFFDFINYVVAFLEGSNLLAPKTEHDP